MSANTAPLFTLTPNVGIAAVGAAANTRSDGVGTIGTDIFKVFTAGANGAWVDRIQLQPVASAAATATTATVHRIYISNKASGATTQADTALLREIGAPSQTADQTTTPTMPLVVALGIFVPAGWTILVSSHHVNAASSGWTATAIGGDY